MNKYLYSQYRETKFKFEKFASRLQKSQDRGEFHTYSRRKQNFLVSRVKKLWEKLRLLEVRLKITTAGVSMALLLMVSNLSAQDQFVLAEDKNPIVPPTISGGSPLLLDVDNDGDLDLLVSAYYTPIGFYRNTGSATVPSFEKVPDESNPFLEINNLEYGYLSTRSIIDGADIDDDGDMDIVASYDIIRNTGTNEAPVFVAEENGWLRRGSDLGDIDGDGDLDVVWGDEYYGVLEIYENIGDANTFTLSVESDTISIANWDEEIGDINDVHVLDIDDDGDFDVLMGIDKYSYDDETGYYSRSKGYRLIRNTGTAQAPVFELEDDTNNPYKDIPIDEIRLGDLDGDGDQDVIFSDEYAGGAIQFFELKDGMTVENAELVPEFYDGVVLSASVITPEFVDIDNDGDLDMFTWSYGAGNAFYELVDTGEKLLYQRSDITAFDFLNSSAYIEIPFFIDLDLDGDTDIVRLDYDGDFSYVYIENTGSDGEPVYAENVPFPPLTDYDYIGFPAFVDIDEDGDLDMFLTSERSDVVRAVYFESTGSDPLDFTLRTGGSNPLAFVNETNFDELREYQTPRFSDIDEDGDIDALFTGEYDLYYFENTGSDPLSGFIDKTESGPFSSVAVGYYNTVNLVDMDGDGDDDLFVHSYYGGTQYYENLGGSGVGIQLDETNFLDVYPNPTVNELNIKLKDGFSGSVDYEVMTIEGKRVESGSIDATGSMLEFKINTESYQPGYYFLRVISDDELYVSKFVKQ